MVSSGDFAARRRERDSAMVLHDAFLVRRESLHGLDEIRNQVVSALQLILNLGPRRLDGFFLAVNLLYEQPDRVTATRATTVACSALRIVKLRSDFHISRFPDFHIPSPTARRSTTAGPSAPKPAESTTTTTTAAAEPSASERTDAAGPPAPRSAPVAPASGAIAATDGDDRHDDPEN
jgi:Predicted membrane protein